MFVTLRWNLSACTANKHTSLHSWNNRWRLLDLFLPRRVLLFEYLPQHFKARVYVIQRTARQLLQLGSPNRTRSQPHALPVHNAGGSPRGHNNRACLNARREQREGIDADGQAQEEVQEIVHILPGHSRHGSVEVGVIVKENGERCQHVDEVRARHCIQPPVETTGDEQGGPGRFNNVDLEERDLLHGLEQGVGLVAKEGK